MNVYKKRRVPLAIWRLLHLKSRNQSNQSQTIFIIFALVVEQGEVQNKNTNIVMSAVKNLIGVMRMEHLKPCTAQDIIRMSEERYIVAGARMFAREATQLFKNKSDKSKSRKTVWNTLRFFAEKARTDEVEAFIYGTYGGIVMEPAGKSKTEYQPICVKPESSKKPVNPYEFISADEQRYRELCQILLEVLMEAAVGIGLMSGRDANEVLNQLISKTNGKTGRTGWKISDK